MLKTLSNNIIFLFLLLLLLCAIPFALGTESRVYKNKIQELQFKNIISFGQVYDMDRIPSALAVSWNDPENPLQQSTIFLKTVDTMYSNPYRYFLPRDAFLNGSESFLGFEVQIPLRN